MKDSIELNIPSKVDYISIIRLTSSSLANNLGFNVDDIEDIKVCISEACVNILNFSDTKQINILFCLEDDNISISIDNVLKDIDDELENSKQGKMGLLIINSLMDKVEFQEDKLTMIKYI